MLANHGMNVNKCLCTDYARIAGLTVKASTTNGTSGLGVYRGLSVYWHLDYGYRWDAAIPGLVRQGKPQFVIERRYR